MSQPGRQAGEQASGQALAEGGNHVESKAVVDVVDHLHSLKI